MTNHDSDYQPSARFGKMTGRRALLIFASFFIIIFSVNGLMVFKALSTFDGVEVEGAYQKSREYNQVIERMEAQEALGWKTDINATLMPGSGNQTSLQVRFSDANGVAVTGLEAVGTFWRPVTKGDDRRMILQETSPGIYEALYDLEHAGNWLVRIAARNADGATFAEEQRVFLREKTTP